VLETVRGEESGKEPTVSMTGMWVLFKAEDLPGTDEKLRSNTYDYQVTFVS